MKRPSKIRLGVNIDHVATLRQVRGGTTSYPDLMHFALEAVRGGAEQITIHLREDRRHIQLADLQLLAKKRPVALNLEMAASEEMLRFAKKYRPDWVCLVPEKRQELTTEGGLDVVKGAKRMSPMIEKLQRIGIEISMFIEPSREQVLASYEVGADAVEFHTGHWVLLKGDKKKREWKRLCEAAKLAHHLGLGVHAGHGLDPEHTRKIRALPELREVNIGHFLVCDALNEGLRKSVRRLKDVLEGK
ncbi:MAG: pyridoxine 5'-phosphate synthase [Bdellovibrionaceae bacterium]|nr:pyridoxine 5'-phosphate synthase [Pseudobdellovibrionaceae bacterium]